MTQHTPGPWTIEEKFDLWINGPDSKPLATVGNHGGLASVGWPNACLIAAAPELLALVRDYLATAMTGEFGPLFAIDEQARALLAKVEGNG